MSILLMVVQVAAIAGIVGFQLVGAFYRRRARDIDRAAASAFTLERQMSTPPEALISERLRLSAALANARQREGLASDSVFVSATAAIISSVLQILI